MNINTDALNQKLSGGMDNLNMTAQNLGETISEKSQSLAASVPSMTSIKNIESKGNKEYFTVDGLKDALGPEMWEGLLNSTIDSGANFLAGQVTSAFAGPTSTLSNVTAFAASSMDTVMSTAAVLNPQFLIEFTSSLVLNSTQVIINELTRITTEKVTEVTMRSLNIPVEISQISLSYFNSYKMSISDMLKELSIPTGERISIKVDLLKKIEENEFIQKVGNFATKAKEKIDTFCGESAKALNMISSYIQNGPEWISKQVNNAISDTIQMGEDYLDKQVALMNEKIDDFVKQKGETAGKILVEKYNNVLKEEGRAILNKIQILAQKATILAFTLMQQAILKVMAITGINIPV